VKPSVPLDEVVDNTASYLLAFAYETQDMQMVELFALERKCRRMALALEILKMELTIARSRVVDTYDRVGKVKSSCQNNGLAAEVTKYAGWDPPHGANCIPAELAYVYQTIGMMSSSDLFFNG